MFHESSSVKAPSNDPWKRRILRRCFDVWLARLEERQRLIDITEDSRRRHDRAQLLLNALSAPREDAPRPSSASSPRDAKNVANRGRKEVSSRKTVARTPRRSGVTRAVEAPPTLSNGFPGMAERAALAQRAKEERARHLLQAKMEAAAAQAQLEAAQEAERRAVLERDAEMKRLADDAAAKERQRMKALWDMSVTWHARRLVCRCGWKQLCALLVQHRELCAFADSFRRQFVLHRSMSQWAYFVAGKRREAAMWEAAMTDRAVAHRHAQTRRRALIAWISIVYAGHDALARAAAHYNRQFCLRIFRAWLDTHRRQQAAARTRVAVRLHMASEFAARYSLRRAIREWQRYVADEKRLRKRNANLQHLRQLATSYLNDLHT